MSALPDLIHRFNAIPIKILASYFVTIDKMMLKFTRRSKKPRKDITEGEEQNGRTEAT